MTKFIIILLILDFLFLILSNSLFNIFTNIIFSISLVLMINSAIYFTKKLNFIQFNFIKQLKAIKTKSKTGISSLESLTLALSSRIGVGAIAGVALAIYLGGPGTIFWMWISGLLISILTFIESYYGSLYKEKTNNNYIGGPSYYIKKGLNNYKLAIIYALIIIISYIIGFLTIQSNTIVKSVSEISSINPIITSFIICILASLIIFRDIKFLTKFSSIIVPIMAILYIIIGLYIILNNIYRLDNILFSIITNAFNIKAGFYGFITTILLGIQRGIFATEAGIGTSSIAASVSKESPLKQALVQTLGIHFTNLIICSITAFIILSSTYTTLDIINPNGIEITLNAFNDYFGNMGSLTLCIITLLFAFTTIVSGYYYAQSNLYFIFPKLTKLKLNIFKLITIIILFIGAISNSTVIWKLIDTFVAILAIINIYALNNLFNKDKITKI